MEVIKQASDDDKEITRSVTTKSVRDWRWKEWKGDGPPKSRWLRRSRLVALEYALDKRDDVFSTASSGHLLRILPVLYLAEVGELKEAAGRSEEEVVLGTMDIKMLFSRCRRRSPWDLRCQEEISSCLRTCQAKGLEERLGLTTLARSWLEELGFEACRLNPCLLRGKKAVLLVHVDDVMVKGESKYILEEILFLKRTYQRLEDGILITPGHYIESMLEAFEEHYGMVRAQKVPCDGSIQSRLTSLPSTGLWWACLYTFPRKGWTLPSLPRNLHQRRASQQLQQ